MRREQDPYHPRAREARLLREQVAILAGEIGERERDMEFMCLTRGFSADGEGADGERDVELQVGKTALH